MSTRTFRITVRGTLGVRFASMLDGMTIENRPGETAFIGDLDQPQLHGIIDRVGDFGLELLRVEEVSR